MAPARPYTVSEDAEIIRLKERLPFTGWSDLAVAFNATFAAALPRPWGTMQVRYSRYLAAGKHHRVRALAALAAAPAGLYSHSFFCISLFTSPRLHNAFLYNVWSLLEQ
jgi:phosphatidylserine decarboxylase